MKKIFTTLSVVFLLFVSSCDQAKSERISVAEKFLTALEEKNFEEAKKYGTEETAQILDFLAGVSTQVKDAFPIPDNSKKEEKNKTKFIVVREEKIDDNNVKVFFREEGKEDKNSSLDLVKIDGKWKVSMKKENPKEEKIKNEGELSHEHNHEESHEHNHEH